MENLVKVKIAVYHANQCDPKKCTALKLRRHGLVRIVPKARFLPKQAIVLNPFSKIAFSPSDKPRISRAGLVGLDCSWEHAEKVLSNQVRGTSRCLPFLLAGNPTNFARATKLSTAEALAAALYISGFKDQAREVLSLFRWGHTFFDLNADLLENYANAKNSTEIIEIMKKKFDESLDH